jgi:peptidyl-dipeptidase Dcp
MNPLIDFPQTPFGSLAFDAIEPAHFMPAAEHWMDVARERISAITENTDTPTFGNTLVPSGVCFKRTRGGEQLLL